MDWIGHCIWWHVYPLGFCDAPIRGVDPAPRLRRLVDWLDYAIEIGVSGLMLGPIFASQTHGYDTVDHFRIDPRLGSMSDFDALVAACRERGLRIVLDGVFNHVGSQHPAYLQALRDGRGTSAFRIDWSAPGGPHPEVFEGHESLVVLNRDVVGDCVVDVMNYWLDRGIDGWRLDAAYAVGPEFWSGVLPRVRVRHPDAWFVGEVIHGDYSGFVASAGVDSVTQYELWKAIWSSLLDRNFFELDWALIRHNGFLEHFTPTTFIGNHDVTRIASTLGPDVAVLALVVLMTVGGIPSIYYGDEQGFTGVKEERVGGDDAVRPAFPSGPGQLANWGADTYRAHQDLIGLRRRHSWLVNATTETISLTNTHYVYRVASGNKSLVVDLDVGESRAEIRDEQGNVEWRTG